jgi:mannose-1-phosphate guanylyltransferase
VVEEGALVEGSVLFEGVRVEEGAVIRNSIVGPDAVVQKSAIVRGLCVLGAGSVIGEENILDRGIRVNPTVKLPERAIAS